MRTPTSITTGELPDLLLHVATVRPVFVWGQPGIGKSALVRDFAKSVGLTCVTLLGTQLAPEDLIGVPQIVGVGETARSRFVPPEMIARPEAYVLFLDELNGSSQEVQKAFYSLILDRRLGNYELHPDTVVIGAGNRAEDMAIVKAMSSALANRMVHVTLQSSPRDWLTWARSVLLNPLVIDYIAIRPDHLCARPPKTEEPYSTPRSWHMLADLLDAYRVDTEVAVSDEKLRLLAGGCVSPSHAGQFVGWSRLRRHGHSLDALLKGNMGWPANPAERDVLVFLASALRARLAKELPATSAAGSSQARDLAHRAKGLLTQLAEISVEVAVTVVAPSDSSADGADLPDWFLTEVLRDLPRLAVGR
ncbi:MAG TPA: MoxR family ATPase, partial [Acidimicrobiales bacterium]|nr:MoxR family ATPase [Acidimicrobiales bacterium]